MLLTILWDHACRQCLMCVTDSLVVGVNVCKIRALSRVRDHYRIAVLFYEQSIDAETWKLYTTYWQTSIWVLCKNVSKSTTDMLKTQTRSRSVQCWILDDIFIVVVYTQKHQTIYLDDSDLARSLSAMWFMYDPSFCFCVFINTLTMIWCVRLFVCLCH